jgi:uncharacterized protein
MTIEAKRRGVSSRGQHFNTGSGNTLQTLDIGHSEYLGLVDPDTAFWALIQKEKLGETLTSGPFLDQYRQKAAGFAAEMDKLRFGVTPSAVYFNPTERCNLNCSYCYLPDDLRKDGHHMPVEKVLHSLEILKQFFLSTLPEGYKPQIIFHGAEPSLNWDALLAAFDRYGDDFRFGIQTNGTVLSDADYDLLMEKNVAIGLSLDCAVDEIVTRTRKTWDGHSIYDKVVAAMDKLNGYANWSVICTVTQENMNQLIPTVEFFHEHGVHTCMLNPVRCTRQGARDIKPPDEEISRYFLAAMDRTEELFKETGRRLVVANFANILISILAPQARRLMCDISPCGGGRAFFAVSANGDVFPCSEFIGLPDFAGGNLFQDKIDDILKTPPFKLVTGRKVEDIEHCNRCAVRHFCGSPCPAEAFEMNGGMDRPGAFCELYEDQVRYALRLIADDRQDAFLWPDWDRDTTKTFELEAAN